MRLFNCHKQRLFRFLIKSERLFKKSYSRFRDFGGENARLQLYAFAGAGTGERGGGGGGGGGWMMKR